MAGTGRVGNKLMATCSDKPVAARSPLAMARLRYGGIHLQEDRDVRRGPDSRRWRCMLRLKLPCGRLTSDQYLALDDVAVRYAADRSFRLTAGRNIELHGIELRETRAAIEAITAAGLALGCSSHGLEFNVAGPALPRAGARHAVANDLAGKLCQRLYPSADSPLPGEVAACLTDPAAAAHLPEHPPRKLTIGVALPEDNSADLYSQDLGLLLDQDDTGGWRVQVFLGGGMSLFRGHGDSFAALARPIGSVALASAVDLVEAVVALSCRELDLTHRRRCRLKYLLARRGQAWLRAELQQYVELEEAGPDRIPSLATPGAPGTERQDRQCLPIPVAGGRVAAGDFARVLHATVETLRPGLVVTPDQNLAMTSPNPSTLVRAQAMLAQRGFAPWEPPDKVRAVTCTGPPHCRWALCESERVLGRLAAELAAALISLGRSDAAIDLRLAACPIGCVRPYAAEIGVVGTRRGRYDVFLGGDSDLPCLAELYVSRVSLGDVVPALQPVLRHWAAYAEPDEGFGAFYRRRFHSSSGSAELSGAFPQPALPRVLETMTTVGAD